MAIFTGSGVAIATPFNNEDKSINYDAFKSLIEFQLENETDSIIVCGTTGEASTLTDEEQIECIRFCVETVNKRVPVIAGTGSNYTAHGIELTKGAKEAGADAALLVTPYYNKTTQKGLYEHYKLIAESVDIPMILYNVPSRTALNIAPKTAFELSKIKNIVGIKEASSNIVQIAEVAALCKGNMDLYAGNDDQVVPILSLGGIGVISVAANVVPKDMHNCVKYFLEGNLDESLNIQLKMLPLVKALFNEVNPIPVKEALNIMGFNAGPCRMPLTSMEESNVLLLKVAMSEYGLI